MAFIKRYALSAATLPGAAGLALLAGLLIFNMTIGMVARGYEIQFEAYRLFERLIGVTNKVERRPLALRNVLDGSFQRSYAQLLGSQIPVFNFAVRLRNQIEFSLFNASPVPTIVVGANRELVERVYVDDYCSRNLVTFIPDARIWAGKIRKMQDLVEAQGKTFIYVLTPSKVAQYPEFLPPGMICPAPLADRIGLVPAWLGLLENAGVHVVDTTAVMSRAHGQYPFLMYPVGGIHWNSVGAALGSQAVAAKLNELRGDGIFAPIDFEWHVVDVPSGDDLDLVELMNLIWLPKQQPMPHVVVSRLPSSIACKATNVFIVGGSFGHALGEYLSQEPCHPIVTEYEYWHVFVLNWQDAVLRFEPFDAAKRSEDYSRSDVVIYEDNEQVLGKSEHGKAFYEFMLANSR